MIHFGNPDKYIPKLSEFAAMVYPAIGWSDDKILCSLERKKKAGCRGQLICPAARCETRTEPTESTR